MWIWVLLFKPSNCFSSSSPTVSSLVWPSLNEKSQQMHFKDTLRVHMLKFEKKQLQPLYYLSSPVLWFLSLRLNLGSVYRCCNVNSLPPCAAGLRPGHDRSVLWWTGRPHLPCALLLCYCSHVQLDCLQRASHLAGEEVRHPLPSGCIRSSSHNHVATGIKAFKLCLFAGLCIWLEIIQEENPIN